MPGWLCVPLNGTVSMTHPGLDEIPDLSCRIVTENGIDSAVCLQGASYFKLMKGQFCVFKPLMQLDF